VTPELALQTALRTRLVATAAVGSLVPAESILDRNGRPNPDPSIIIGEGLSIDDGDSIARDRTRIVLDLHVWRKEPSTAGVKAIAGAMRTAIRSAALDLAEGFHAVDCRVSSMRFLRDPDGETSHAVVTVEAIVQEVP
jgi:hypothetical protein